MIDVEILKRVKTIVTHEGCADGIASALILKDALPYTEIVFVQYNTERWKLLVNDDRRAGPWLFCDMTPPPEDADAFVRDGAVVLDHHRGARELVARFGDRGVFADEDAEPGVSGALLAFREVWMPVVAAKTRERKVAWPNCFQMQEFAVLAGIRDTWQRSSDRWEEACAQAVALRFWPWEDLESQFGFWDTFNELMRVGPVLRRKDAEQAERTIREAYYFNVGDAQVAAFEGLHTSDVADQLAAAGVDLVLGWHYTCEGGTPKMVVSCRSRGPLTALALAKRHGGGGHERAAGFKVDLHRWASDTPYAFIKRLVTEHVIQGDA